MNNEKSLTSPPDAFGALYFLPGQYLFKTIRAGRETVKALSSEQIAGAFREVRTDSNWIDRKIMRYREELEQNAVLSCEAPGIRTILVETRDGETLEIRSPMPTLVLLGTGKEYYLWAAKQRKVDRRSKLSIAPLPNIGINGKICFGKNEVPETRIETTDKVWDLIWNTPFNGDQTNNKCISEPEDVRDLLIRSAEHKLKKFPASELIESNTKIEDIWARIVDQTTRSSSRSL